jgi:hypothetical protein
MVKALAAGAVLVAAALPMALSGVAGAAGTDPVTGVTFSIAGGVTGAAYFGTGAAGTFDVAGTFAGDGGNTTVTTTAPGVTFTVLANVNTTDITGKFASTSATVPGSYPITVTDNAGTGTETGAFTVYGDPSVTSATPASLPDVVSPTATTVTIAGAGFVADGVAANPVVTFTSTVDGTSLWVTTPAGGGTSEILPTSSLTVSVDPVNSINHTVPATPGTYTVTVTNADGGSFTSGPIFTILGNEISTVSPSAIIVPGSGTTNASILVSGGGFQSGATLALGTCAGVTLSGASVTSSSTITASVAVPTGTTVTRCNLTVTNNGTGGNGASYTATGAIGIGKGSLLAPSITASSLSTGAALVAGAPSTTITFTGVGFSPYTTPTTSTYGATNAADAAALVGTGCIANSAGTSLTCPIQVNTGSFAGPHTANLDNTAATAGSMGSLANAFTVDGPSIVSASPAALAVGAAIGTVVALTGTGFTNTSSGGVVIVNPPNTGVLNGTFQYVSATSMNFVVTHSPTIADNGDTLSVHSVDAYGATENSAPFALGVDAAPVVTSITYKTGTTGVGAGATAQPITINGTGFRAGATVTGFTNATSVADAAVTATVTAVNNLGTQITATVTIAAADVNTVDGYLVTNTDGGVAKAFPVAPAGLTIDAGPTVTAVSPSPLLANATNAVTITGTGFKTGAAVTATAGGTCGVATVVSATSITVSCTFGAVPATGSSLVVTNLDGGSATSAPAVTPPPAPKHPHATKVHGSAVIGKTVTLTISGTGFYGKPRVTSTGSGVRVAASHDSGTLLTVRITVSAKGKKGEHTLTITDPDGKSCRINYATK